jgi:hypothetical protein
MSLEDSFKYSLLDFNNINNNNNFNLVLAPEDSYLEDLRILQDFKKVTYGNHLKTEASKQFDVSIINCDIEKACYWGYQLLASGCINQLWDKCYTIIYKNINIQNPNAPLWILDKEKLFRKIFTAKLFVKDNILNTRNIQQIRNLLTELIVFMCLSNKRKLDTITFKFNIGEFDLKTFYTRLKYKDTIAIKSILGPNDSREIILACNELFYCIKNKNIQEILYWLTWINTWEKINIKKYKSFHVQSRSIEGIDTQYQKDVIWFVWSVIQLASTSITTSSNTLSTKKQENLNALWLLYIFNWKPGIKTKRYPIIIWYISLLISPFTDFNIPAVNNSKLYIKVISNVNLMFKKIKNQSTTQQHTHHYTQQQTISKPSNTIGNNINIIIENDNQQHNPTYTTTRNEIINDIYNSKKTNNNIPHTRQPTRQNQQSTQPHNNTTQSKLDLLFKLDGYL